MSLDPQMASLLVAMNAQGLPDLDSLTAESFRKIAGSKAITSQPVESVRNVRDIEINGPGGPLPLRIYQPESMGSLPVLVYFHGGGFVLGDLDSHDNVCRALCNVLPAVVVSVGYRLAPESKFPAATLDAYAATAWASANATELGADPARLVVGGDSAGGNLAAVVCQQARDLGTPAIAHQLLFYPVCDNDLNRDSYARVGTGYFLETGMMRWFWEQYLNTAAEGASPLASPIKGSLSALPPATIVTAEYDPLCDEGEDYARRLNESGVPASHFRVAGAIHGFMSFVGLIELADRTLRTTAEAVNTAWAPQSRSATR
jgi:acetyl esterase